jgi:hypothetical protein
MPAFVWRWNALRRALTIGTVVGRCLGALAWIDSGVPLAGLIVFGVVGGWYGWWMHRRMTRFWRGAKDLTGAERVMVADAVRRGEPLTDSRMARSVVDYSRGLHAAADGARPYRWLLPLVLVVAVGSAVWDAAFGSWGNVVVSAIYLVALLVDVFWWPKHSRQLLANAARAAELTESASGRQ